MGKAMLPNLFLSALQLRRDYDLYPIEEDSNDLSTVLAARSRDAILRSRALLARTGNCRGMKFREKPQQK